MFKNFYNEIDFFFRKNIRLKRKYTGKKEPKESLFEHFFGEKRQLAEEKEKFYFEKYHLQEFKDNSTCRNYLENLAVIELLESCFNKEFLSPTPLPPPSREGELSLERGEAPITGINKLSFSATNESVRICCDNPIKILDIGSKNWFYSSGEWSFFKYSSICHPELVSGSEIPKQVRNDIDNCQNIEEFLQKLEEIGKYLKETRPTAVNLAWAVDIQLNLAREQILKQVQNDKEIIEEITKKLEENAVKLLNDDIEINKKIGEHGSKIVPKGATILTHCNAGALATAGYGTALGVVRSAFAKDNTVQVFADETRPRQQGARLTTWELVEDKIPTTLITDGMCGYFMKKRMIDVVIVGADRIAANGDTANKIGTYTVALAAKAHNIPFYIAAPYSTIDMSITSGDEIPIEERNREEVTHINGKTICAEGVNIINPAFDVTPAEYITGIITETGIHKPSELKNLNI